MTRPKRAAGGGSAVRGGSRSALRREDGAAAIDLTDPPVRVALRRSPQAKRLVLSVSHIDGAARLTVPAGCAAATARRFLDDHRDWLRAAVDRSPPLSVVRLGAAAPFRGAMLTVVAKPAGSRGGEIRRDEGVIAVPPGRACVGAQVAALFKEEARARLLERSQAHAAALGAAFDRIALRDTRSRWGSCSSRGTLSYSWRLIMAPDDVLDYVAAHEAAHLLEMNHSARFWAHVARLRPDWKSQRDWLRRHGADLHRVRFDAA